jgi:hypothetical protein
VLAGPWILKTGLFVHGWALDYTNWALVSSTDWFQDYKVLHLSTGCLVPSSIQYELESVANPNFCLRGWAFPLTEKKDEYSCKIPGLGDTVSL